MSLSKIAAFGSSFGWWTNLACKAAARQPQGRQSHVSATRANPFLPDDDALFATDVSATHVGLLNKYNVMDHHLLIVTRAFEAQEGLLNARDFEALCRCLLEVDGLAFYNVGAAAGARQRHKHLQLVPLPLAHKDQPYPFTMSSRRKGACFRFVMPCRFSVPCHGMNPSSRPRPCWLATGSCLLKFWATQTD